jgi:hypothetical protein
MHPAMAMVIWSMTLQRLWQNAVIRAQQAAAPATSTPRDNVIWLAFPHERQLDDAMPECIKNGLRRLRAA